MSQLGIPVEISPVEVGREATLGGAIDLCTKAAGVERKQAQADLHFDKGQFSRWIDGTEGVMWPKFKALMDYCGNDAPLFWMLQDRGYDISSLRKKESETERALRLATERISQLEQEREVERRLFRELRSA